MPVIINGSTGISGTDGSAGTPAVQGTDTNTGMFFPAADQVALAANGTQVLLGTSTGVTITGTQSISGNLSFNSGYGSAAVAYGCRAWVSFDGRTGGTVTIKASGNVSSITDLGVGAYRVNYTNAIVDANYATFLDMTPSVTNNGSDTFPISAATGSVELRHYEDGILRDSDYISVAVFR